jgi:hypothetical protein
LSVFVSGQNAANQAERWSCRKRNGYGPVFARTAGLRAALHEK